MDNTTMPAVPVGESPLGSTMNGFGYGIGVTVGVLILITTLLAASYYCTRIRTRSPTTTSTQPNQVTDVEGGGGGRGLDEATLKTYPKLLYSQAKRVVGEGTVGCGNSCCSICLADYKDGDVLRALPDCKHLFHLGCVDPWLRLHPTCPVCRTSPLLTPLPTPLAEVAPLAELSSMSS